MFIKCHKPLKIFELKVKISFIISEKKNLPMNFLSHHSDVSVLKIMFWWMFFSAGSKNRKTFMDLLFSIDGTKSCFRGLFFARLQFLLIAIGILKYARLRLRSSFFLKNIFNTLFVNTRIIYKLPDFPRLSSKEFIHKMILFAIILSSELRSLSDFSYQNVRNEL